MKDDIETLGPARPYEEIEQLRADRDRLQGRVGTLQKALDDRWAADLKAAKAIFAETGRTQGFPSVKEVVAFYMAEVERLEKDLETLKAEAMVFLRRADCAEASALQYRAKLDRAKEALEKARTCIITWSPVPTEPLEEVVAVLSELSADAPARVCKNCGSTETIEELRARKPKALSCCPERDMVDAPAQQTQISEEAEAGWERAAIRAAIEWRK